MLHNVTFRFTPKSSSHFKVLTDKICTPTWSDVSCNWSIGSLCRIVISGPGACAQQSEKGKCRPRTMKG
jgi:hypothetical protein